MNSEFMISRTNLATCLTDSWFMVGQMFPNGIPNDAEIDEVILHIPEQVPVEVKFKHKEVAH